MWPRTARAQWSYLWDLGFAQAPQETMVAVAIDAGRRVHTVFEVGRGTMTEVDCHFPTLIGGVCKSGAEMFILVHNHPTGNVKPSVGDVELTQQVAVAASLAGLWLMDHLIVGNRRNQVLSMVAERYWQPAPYGSERNTIAEAS